MNTTLVLQNILAWSLQVAVLATIAALVSMRWDHARAKLVFWQGVLGLILLLPVSAPWHEPPAVAADAAGVSFTQGPAASVEAARSLLARVCNRESILCLMGAGTLIRFAWIGIGLGRLRRLRMRAESLPAQAWRKDVRWHVSPEVAGPVTYGWLRPCVLLPNRVMELAEPLRRAIVCHELVHVERRDWLLVLAEEAVRAALWFHPAVWFALGRIQLAREQAVDEEVVRRTSDRENYVNALLAVAGQRLEADVAPAPLFLKKRQLAVRVAAVVKEATMSQLNSLFRFTSAAGAALAAVALGVWMFPLQSAAQALPDDAGITCDAGATLLHRPPLRYPAGSNASGLVVVEASVGKDGQVTDAHVISGPEELRRTAIENVLQWHYASQVEAPLAPAAPSAVRVTIQFGSAAPAAVVGRGALRGVVTGDLGRLVVGAAVDVRNTETGAVAHTDSGADGSYAFVDLPAGAYELSIHAPKLRRAVRSNVAVRAGGDVRLDLRLQAEPDRASGADVAPPAPPAAPQQRIRVGGNLQAAHLLTKIAPKYPAEAKAARVQGTVSLAVVIGKDGLVLNIDVISGDPLLVGASVEAVRQWVYQPTLLNGEAVEVVTQVDVNFTLVK